MNEMCTCMYYYCMLFFIRLEDFVFVLGKESFRRFWGSNRFVFDGVFRCYYFYSLYLGE